jgi:hypothetical protein
MEVEELNLPDPAPLPLGERGKPFPTLLLLIIETACVLHNYL